MKNYSPTVDFVVPSENVQTVVTLLLSHKISFTLNSSNYPDKLMASNFPEIEPSDQPSLTTKDRKSVDAVEYTKYDVNTIKAIYQKYLVESIEKIPPQEAQIAAEYGIGLIEFKNAFKAIYGKPFYQRYMDKRMEHAAKLLRLGYKGVEVSKRIGYGDKSCIKFNKMFQKHFGITPKKYQMAHFGRIDRR